MCKNEKPRSCILCCVCTKDQSTIKNSGHSRTPYTTTISCAACAVPLCNVKRWTINNTKMTCFDYFHQVKKMELLKCYSNEYRDAILSHNKKYQNTSTQSTPTPSKRKKILYPLKGTPSPKLRITRSSKKKSNIKKRKITPSSETPQNKRKSKSKTKKGKKK